MRYLSNEASDIALLPEMLEEGRRLTGELRINETDAIKLLSIVRI